MRNEDYLGYITDHLTTRELLEQLAEEAAELSQAVLKTCRTLDDSNNPTSAPEDEVWQHLDEEMVDVLNALCAELRLQCCGQCSAGLPRLPEDCLKSKKSNNHSCKSAGDMV